MCCALSIALIGNSWENLLFFAWSLWCNETLDRRTKNWKSFSIEFDVKSGRFSLVDYIVLEVFQFGFHLLISLLTPYTVVSKQVNPLFLEKNIRDCLVGVTNPAKSVLHLCSAAVVVVVVVFISEVNFVRIFLQLPKNNTDTTKIVLQEVLNLSFVVNVPSLNPFFPLHFRTSNRTLKSFFKSTYFIVWYVAKAIVEIKNYGSKRSKLKKVT